jgi:hypothetical protein
VRHLAGRVLPLAVSCELRAVRCARVTSSLVSPFRQPKIFSVVLLFPLSSSMWCLRLFSPRSGWRDGGRLWGGGDCGKCAHVDVCYTLLAVPPLPRSPPSCCFDGGKGVPRCRHIAHRLCLCPSVVSS